MRTGEEIHVETERDVFERLRMQYIPPGERDKFGTGFHYTKADRAKQLLTNSPRRVTENNVREDTAPEQPALSVGRRRRLFLVGDHNLMSPESWDNGTLRRLPAEHCVGALLQQEASKRRDVTGEVEVRAYPRRYNLPALIVYAGT